MKYFIGFQKKKALYLGNTVTDTTHINAISLATSMLNEELINMGFILAPDTFQEMIGMSLTEVDKLYHELIHNIKEIMPDGENYVPIHKGFPQSVMDKTHEELMICRTMSYLGVEINEDEYLEEWTDNVDTQALTQIGTLNEKQFTSIFTNLLSSPSSLSRMDLKIVNWFLLNKYPYKVSDIKFKETLAHVGAYCLDNNLPISTRNATDILRIWSGYSGGDVGLVENTKFKNPTSRQRKQLLSLLDNCYNLEEAFKMDRERWLRILFFLHPMTTANKFAYPNLHKYTDLLRNNPKELKTFNAYVEEGLENEDTEVLKLLSKRMGVFSRRLDHCIRIFGDVAVYEWLSHKPNLKQRIEVYNHLYNRDKVQTRSAVLASQSNSTAVTYKALDALPTIVVTKARDAIRTSLENDMAAHDKVFIDPKLYNRSLGVNNRAASDSISTTNTGSFEVLDDTVDRLRLYVLWEGRSDIDFSGYIITEDGKVHSKIGYGGRSNAAGDSIVYSGDNTGVYQKNAEYLDINLKALVREIPNVEWVLMDARVFSGQAFNKQKAYSGFMIDTKGFINSGRKWYPEYNANASKLETKAKVSFLNAYHVPTNSVVHLDMTQPGSIVGDSNTVEQFYPVLSNYTPTVSDEISWEKIKQGHILNLISKSTVDNPEDADIIFDENTTTEEVFAAMNGVLPTS